MSNLSASPGGIRGTALVGTADAASPETFRAVDPATGAPLDPPLSAVAAAEVAAACGLAEAAFPGFSQTDPQTRRGG